MTFRNGIIFNSINVFSHISFLFTGKTALAIDALAPYRPSRKEAKLEVEKLVDLNQKEDVSGVGFSELFSAPYSRPMTVIILMLVAQQATGMIGITSNAVSIFKDFGTTVDPSFCTVMIGVVNILITLVGAEVHSRFNRKSTLLVSTMFLVNVLFMLAVYYSFFKFGGVYASWAESNRHVPIILLVIYYAAFGIGLGPIPFMYLGEGLPNRIRGPATGIALTINTLVIVALLMTFNELIDSLGYSVLFTIFSIVTAILTMIILNLMQETKGLSITDIDVQYEKLKRVSLKNKND